MSIPSVPFFIQTLHHSQSVRLPLPHFSSSPQRAAFYLRVLCNEYIEYIWLPLYSELHCFLCMRTNDDKIPRIQNCCLQCWRFCAWQSLKHPAFLLTVRHNGRTELVGLIPPVYSRILKEKIAGTEMPFGLSLGFMPRLRALKCWYSLCVGSGHDLSAAISSFRGNNCSWLQRWFCCSIPTKGILRICFFLFLLLVLLHY